MIRRRLGYRLVAGRRFEVATLLFITAALSFLFTSVLVLRATATDAVVQSVKSANGGFAFALQSGEEAAVSLLAQSQGVYPVWDWNGAARSDDLQVPLRVRAAGPFAARQGVLVTGRFPQKAGEAVVTRTAARSLGLQLDELVLLTGDGPGSGAATVVGVTVDPADRLATGAVVLAEGDQNNATTWYTNQDPIDDAMLGPPLQARQITFRTVNLLAQETPATSLRTFSTVMRSAVPACFLLAVLLTSLFVLGLRRQNVKTVDALVAVGMRRSEVARLLLTVVAAVMVAGAAAGAGLAGLGLSVFRSLPAGLLNQDWVRVNWPVVPQLLYGLLVPVSVALVVIYLHRVALPFQHAASRRESRNRTAIPVLVLSVVVYALVYVQVLPVGLTTLAGCGVLLSAVALVPALITRGQGPAVRVVTARNGAALSGLAAVLAVLSFLTGLYASRSAVASKLTVDSTYTRQPAGSLLLFGVNEAGEALLKEGFHSLGGRETLTLIQPNEAGVALRSTSPGLVACLAKERLRQADAVLDRCGPTGTSVPINTIALTDRAEAGGGPVLADPALLDTGGNLGLLSYSTQTQDIAATAVEPAVGSTLLGGLMPGAVVTSGSSVASRYDLRPSGIRYLLLRDFAALTEQDQARLRALVTDVASTAQVAEDRGPDDAGRRARGLVVSAVGTAVGMLLLLVGAASYLTSSSRFRADLGALGVTRYDRVRLGLRIFGTIALVQVLLVPVLYFTAWLQAARQGSLGGWDVPAPAVAVLVLCVGSAVAFARSPRS